MSIGGRVRPDGGSTAKGRKPGFYEATIGKTTWIIRTTRGKTVYALKRERWENQALVGNEWAP